jgi:kynurenine formamidase
LNCRKQEVRRKKRVVSGRDGVDEIPTRWPSADVVRAAVGLVGSGRVFDLDIGRFPGMPHHPAQPGFDLVTYRSPRGQRNSRQWSGGEGAVDADNFGYALELVTTTMHMGTHVDALCHVTAGPDCHGYGGFREGDHLGDQGALVRDATELPPILARGVLLDVARALGMEELPDGFAIGVDDVVRARDLAGVALQRGDVVLVRTGHLRHWPEYDFGRGEPGLSLEAALWLAEHRPLAIGADNSAVEVLPSVVPHRVQPVHVELIVERGIYLIEWVGLEALAASASREFLFVCLPLKISGATGSLARPVAIA